MATTQNTYTGDGSTTNYSFTFEYLKQSDVKVTLDTVATTAFTFANATTLSFTTAPANNVDIRIFRDTAIDLLSATFFPGSAIKAEDLNQNFTQSLYVTQESETDVGIADTNASNAVTTANAAETTANAAETTADAAETKADTAVTTANSAVTTANGAVTTANTASTNASAAVVTANAAAASVSAAVLFELVADVAAIPGSPADDDYVEVADSTGIESFSPLSGVPSGFTGASGLTVRIRYDDSASSWVYMSYFANDSEDRYFTKASGNTNTTNIATNTTDIATNTTDIATNTTDIATKMPLAGGTFTGAVSFDDDTIIKGDATNGSGQITLNCEVNTHGVKIKGPPHSAAANYTLTLPNDAGTNGQSLTTNGSGTLTWATPATDSITEGNTSAEVIDTGSDGRFVVITEGSEALRIDSSGRVGIGTTSPGTYAKFAVWGTENIPTYGDVSAIFSDGTTGSARFHHASGNVKLSSDSALAFGTGTSATERMRIDSSGNVGIGTSSPGSLLQVNSAAGTISGIALGTTTQSITASRYIGICNNADHTSIGTNSGFSGIEFGGPSSANEGYLAFHTHDVGVASGERMRIDKSGRIFTYNSNTGNNSLTVANAAAAGTTVANFIGTYGSTGINTGTSSFIVWTNGNVVNTNNSYGAISDVKLKENIVDASSQWNDLKALQVRNYNFKEGQVHTQLGLIAQEVELVSPGLVTESPDRDEDGNDLGTVTKSVNYSVLYMKAVKALQEAMERIETLEQRLTDAGL